MDSRKKQQAREILEYWKTIEFLGQTNMTPQSNESKQLLRGITERGERPNLKKLEVFHNTDGSFDVKKMLETDKASFDFLPVTGEECAFCMGKILRNDLVEYLSKYIPECAELPELAYGDKEAIAWFTFRSDMKGGYKKNSFKLSPLLWALREWKQQGAQVSHDFSFDMGRYGSASGEIEKMLEEYEEEYGEINTADFLEDIFGYISKEYAEPFFPGLAVSLKHRGFCEYNRYKNEAEKKKDKDPADYTDMGRSFYSSDIDRLKREIENGRFGSSEGSEYEKAVVDFILSAAGQDGQSENRARRVISPGESPQRSFETFSEILHIKNAPNGKWPARFMPSLMQQTAINLAIDKKGSTPVFSVNGPPGTGKTTLLKEVLADRIVERAFLLASKAGEEPDSVFEECRFRRGPLEKQGNAYVKNAPNYYKFKYDEINDYGVLVTSCNNSAVENITRDLPKGGDVLKDLDSSEIKDENVKKGVDGIRKLFDINESEDIETVEETDEETGEIVKREVRDIFFTRYANKLMPGSDCWGLISAPLGKRENIKNYCASVLTPFLTDYGSPEVRAVHLERYRRRRTEFLKQYEYVRQLKAELSEICGKCGADPESFKLPEKYAEGENKISVIDREFINRYASEEEEISTAAQLANPWASDKLNRERERLFYCACKLHKEFAAASDAMRQNMTNLTAAWNMCGDASGRMAYADRLEAFPVLLQSLFILTPVISTTFASVQSFLSDVQRSGVIGTLIVDEAGQAQPQEAAGALYRCRKAIIVGDPKQIEPVVTAETDMLKQLFTSRLLKGYKDKKLSVQGFADSINPYGTFLGQGEEREWVGCPLVVHRRCADPMYSISNRLSYDNTMKNKDKTPKSKAVYILPSSCWINVRGSERGNKDHYVKAQGDTVIKLLEASFKKAEKLPELYIITPFTSVKEGIKGDIRKSRLYRDEPRVKAWLGGNNIGTVHTFQGKGTEEVIFLLGCDEKSASAANWVNKNIVNVAATRAKQRFYMIGDADVWKGCKPVMTARRIINCNILPGDIEGLASGKAAVKPAAVSGDPGKQDISGNSGVSGNSEICPECGKKLVVKDGRFGKFLSCSGFPECGYTHSINKNAPIKGAVKAAAPPKAGSGLGNCPKCGKELVVRDGKFGKFVGCVGYRECGFSRKLQPGEGDRS